MEQLRAASHSTSFGDDRTDSPRDLRPCASICWGVDTRPHCWAHTLMILSSRMGCLARGIEVQTCKGCQMRDKWAVKPKSHPKPWGPLDGILQDSPWPFMHPGGVQRTPPIPMEGRSESIRLPSAGGQSRKAHSLTMFPHQPPTNPLVRLPKRWLCFCQTCICQFYLSISLTHVSQSSRPQDSCNVHDNPSVSSRGTLPPDAA